MLNPHLPLPPTAEYLSNHRLIAYGAGLCLLQTQAAGISFSYAVDDTPGLPGTEVGGVMVYPFTRLSSEMLDDTLIVICASRPQSISKMSATLMALGLQWGKHYIESDWLHVNTMCARMEEKLSVTPCIESFHRTRLLSLYLKIPNLSSSAGTWLLTQLIEQRRDIEPFPIVECGVYAGGNALTILLNSPAARRNPYYLLDSFQGLTNLSKDDPISRQHEFSDMDVAQVRNVFQTFRNVHIRQGDFQETVPALPHDEFGLIYVDCDLYEPTAYLIEHFYKRLVKNGLIVFHDYWAPENDPPHIESFKGVRKAVHEFLGSEADRVIVFPETTHAILQN